VAVGARDKTREYAAAYLGRLGGRWATDHIVAVICRIAARGVRVVSRPRTTWSPLNIAFSDAEVAHWVAIGPDEQLQGPHGDPLAGAFGDEAEARAWCERMNAGEVTR
jgi:hypothetical protein